MSMQELEVANRVAKLAQIAQFTYQQKFTIKEWTNKGEQTTDSSVNNVTTAENIFLSLMRSDENISQLLRKTVKGSA